MVGKRRSRKARTDVEVILEGFPPSSLILPVRDMERILALGQSAVPGLLSALDRWRDDQERDLFPLVVLLGELGPADAVDPLVELLEGPEDLFLCEAAAEALAKIGDPAVPSLKRLAQEGEARTRVFAYGALGGIPGEETYRFLLEALEHDPELAMVVAEGVAIHGGREAVPALLRALERCPPWQRIELEANIRLVHGLEPKSTRRTEDWRLLYRVIPRLGTLRPGPLVVASVVLENEEEMSELASFPVRTLEEILAGSSGEDPDLCEDCGEPLMSHTGIPVCPDDAVFVSLIQHRLLEKARDDYDEEDLFGLLEALESEALWMEEEDELEDPREVGEREDPRELEELEEELEEEREEVGLLIQTCRWLVGQEVEEVGAGRALLLAHAGELADRFGDPEGLLPLTRPVAGSSRPGRNDPCPCGSGKKYKKCCGKAEPANLRLVEPGPTAGPDPRGAAGVDEDPRGPESRLFDSLFSEVLRMARRSMARPEQEQALVRFLGPEFKGCSLDTAAQRIDPMWAAESFFEWMVCDFRRRDGRTLLEEFLGRRGRTLDAGSQALLERAASTFMSLYRIEEIRYEEGFTLKDLFLGETVEVKERIGTRQLVRWDLIATRILEMDGALRLTGGIIPFPLKDKDAVLETLGVEYVRFRAVHSGASKEEFLKEEGGVLYRLARQRLDAPLPSLLTSDGDSVAFCRARYHIEEPAGLPEKIGSIPGMEAEEGPKVFFRWVEPVGEEKGSVPEAGGPSAGSGESLVFTSMFGSGRSLGSIEVSGDRLVLECMSEARLARGRALLEEHLAGTIIHRGDTVQDPWQAIAERKEEGSVRERRPSDSIPPEVEKQLYLDFMDQHYQDWLDEPLPALSGMNPREAVAAKGGRSRVAELIRQIEHGQAVQHREKGFAFDTSWLWEELGLDPAQD